MVEEQPGKTGNTMHWFLSSIIIFLYWQEFCPQDQLNYGKVDIRNIAGVFIMLSVGLLISFVALMYEYYFYKYYKGSKIEKRVNDKYEKYEEMKRTVVEKYEKILRCGRAKKIENKPGLIQKLDVENK